VIKGSFSNSPPLLPHPQIRGGSSSSSRSRSSSSSSSSSSGSSSYSC